jgi:hypothetical protein
MPNRQQRTAGYGENVQAGLEWAGDTATPGAVPAKAANGATAPAPANGAPQPAPYDDGFGPLPSAGTSPAAPTATAPPPPASGDKAPAATAQGFWAPQAPRARALDAPTVTATGQPVSVEPPPIFEISGWKRELIMGAIEILTGPLGATIGALRAAAATFGVSIGLGPGVSAGFINGAGLGVGLIFGPHGEVGAYGQAELDVGLITSISATMQVTIVNGGLSAFNGWGTAVAIGGGEEIVGGAAALFNDKGEFVGVTLQAGVGVGASPVDIYLAAQRSTSVRVMALAQAQGLAPATRSAYHQRGRPQQVWSKPLTARGLSGGDPLSVDVKYRMFIPSPLIDSPTAVYGGDGRSFAYDSGSSRGEIQATVRLTPGGGIDGIDIIDRHWGESTEYATSDSYHPDGKPDWWLEKVNPDVQPTARQTLQVSDSNLNITAGGSTTANIAAMAEQASLVTISAAGALPLSMVAPDIDATVAVFLRVNGGSVEARAYGSHDGFPCHELYVNGQRIYSYDPVAAGNGPTNLMPPEDIDVSTSWTTVATVTAASQGLGLRARALDATNECWSLNWDDVDLIPQPTDRSCWAASAAMLIGWRDRKSISPQAIGDICGRSLSDVLPFGQEQAIADALGLQTEPPMCYSAEGFRNLLETYGPLWISSVMPGDHATVVTGMYNDGFGLYVRITDPLDRVVGTPGSPGPQQSGHTTGSRYIMTFDELMREYELGAGRPAGTLQILHSPASAVFGRSPNRVDGRTAGYAQSLGRGATARRPARAMSADDQSFSINWDDVELIAQPTDMGCWATAAAMVVGWRDRQSVDPATLAQNCPIPATAMDDGISPQQFEELARSQGLIAEPPACYTAEGFRQILERSGPLWVAGLSPGKHIRVVTGMYNDGTGVYVRITDPWDRVVGTPGAPGPIPDSHNTGSRYIMTYDAFAAEYEAAGEIVPAGTMQILHARPEDIADRTPNRADGRTAGYAQGLSRGSSRTPSRGLAVRALDAPMLPGLEFAATAWNAGPPTQLNRECDELLPADQKVAYWKGLLDGLVGMPTAAKLTDLPAVARDRGWTVAVGAGATPGVALASALGSGLAIDPQSQPYSFGIGRLDGGPPADPFEVPTMASVTDGRPQITIVEGGADTLLKFGRVCAFRTQDRRVQNGAALLAPDGTFLGASFQLEVNGLKAEDILDAVKVGYAAAPARFGTFVQRAPQPVGQSLGRGRTTARSLDDSPPAPGSTIGRTEKDVGGVRFSLAQLMGYAPPQTQATVVITPMPGRRIVLNDWPFLDSASGRTHGDVSIDWFYSAGAVGEVKTDAAGAQTFDSTGLTVTTSIVNGPSEPTVAAITICVRYVFTQAGQPDQVAVTEVTLFGDGREPTRTNRQELSAIPIGAN